MPAAMPATLSLHAHARPPRALQDQAEEATGLRLHRPAPADPAPSGATRWAINGHPATILTWSAEEYARLPARPADAWQAANGIWVALRMA